jgi:hypothetical protein
MQRLRWCSEVTTTAAVIAEDTPVLEAPDGVLDACSTSAMPLRPLVPRRAPPVMAGDGQVLT